MSFLGFLGHKIRNGLDDVGSFVTGQPAHGPSISAPQIQRPIQPPIAQQPKFNPTQPNFGINNPLAPKAAQTPFGPISQPKQSTPQNYGQPLQPQRNIFERGFDQLNPFDNGRTFKQATPTNQRSILGQATHNGITNTVGNIVVKPVMNTVKVAPDAAKMLYDSATNAPLQNQVNDANATANAWRGSIPGFVSDQVINAGRALWDIVPTVSAEITNNAEAENKSSAAGARAFNNTVVGQMVRPAAWAIEGLAHQTPQDEQAMGLNPNETGAQKYLGDPVSGIVGTLGLLKGGAQLGKKAVPNSVDDTAIEAPQTTVPGISREEAQAVLKQRSNPAEAVRTQRLSQLTNDKPTQFVPVNELNSYEGAPDRAQVEFYKKQIQSGQQSQPLIAIRDSRGRLGIEDGKHRLEAYKELGIERAPVKIADWSELKNLSSGKIGVKAPKTQTAKLRTTTSNSDSGIVQEPSGRVVKASNVSVPPKSVVADAGPKPAVFVPKARLEADPELQSLYSTAEKAQFLSPLEQLKAEESVAQHMRLRNSQAEGAALDHLKNGGTRDEAIDIYRKNAPGVSKKMAAYRISRAAKEANQALNPNKHGINPELKSFKNEAVQAGDYKTAAQRYHAVNEMADMYRDKTIKSLNKLSKNDRASFYDYVQGVKEVSTAENPKAVQTAVDTFRKGADTMHALDTRWGGGKTAYIQNFFPDYWSDDPKNTELMQHQAEQQLEEELGPREWNKLSAGERAQLLAERNQNFSLDTDNYSGFRNQARVFANRAEGLEKGLIPRFTDPREDVARYFNGAKINIAPQALIKGAREADVLEENIRNSIDLPESKSFQVSDRGKKELRYLGRPTKGPVLKALRAANKTVGTVINQVPVVHGFNQEGNAMFAAAWRMPGNKLINMTKIMINQAKVSDKDVEDFYRDGNFSPKYGLGSNGFIARGMRKAGINPDKVNIGPRSMAHIEQTIRVAIWKRGQELRMSPEQITEQINHALGSPKRVGEMESAAGIFMHYLHTNVTILKDAVKDTAKGKPNSLIGIAVGYAAWQTGNQILQNITGNEHATLHAPGAVGTLNQLLKAPGQLENGQTPSIITSHTNPLITAIANQEAGKNNFTGKQFQDGGDRAQDFVNTLFSPVASAGKVADGKSTFSQQALQDFGGVSLPHVKGTMAAPNFGADSTLNEGGSTPDTNKVYNQVQQYYKGLNNLNNSLSGRDKTSADEFLSKDKTPDGQTILLSPGDTIANWAGVADRPTALSGLQKFYQSQANHNPEWDLNDSQLQVWARYKSLAPGDLQKIAIAQQNSWITDKEQQINTWYNQQTFNGNTVNAPGYIPYPQIDQSTQNMMNQITQLSSIPAANRTPDQIAQLSALNNNQGVQNAYQALNDYTDNVRKQLNLPAIQRAPQASPAVNAFMNQYIAADKATRNTLRSQYPQMYAQMQDVMERQDLANVSKYGGEMYYGAQVPNSFLSGIYGLGSYDISKIANPNGTSTFALNDFSGNMKAPGGLPTVAANGSNGVNTKSSSKSLYYGMKHAKLKRTYVKKAYISNPKAYGKKASIKKVYTSEAKLKRLTQGATKIKVKSAKA